MYSTDLTDQQWAHVAPFIPLPKSGGRPRATDERAVVNAILYFVVNGCKWRSLPNDFPPWQTVYRYFQAWARKGVWRKLHAALYQSVRAHEGTLTKPTALIVDSQSVKTGKLAAVHTRGLAASGSKAASVTLSLTNLVFWLRAASLLPIHTIPKVR